MTKLLTVSEVAELLNTKEQRVYSLSREKIIPCVKLGRQIRWSEDALNEFIAGGGKSYDGGWRKES